MDVFGGMNCNLVQWCPPSLRFESAFTQHSQTEGHIPFGSGQSSDYDVDASATTTHTNSEGYHLNNASTRYGFYSFWHISPEISSRLQAYAFQDSHTFASGHAVKRTRQQTHGVQMDASKCITKLRLILIRTQICIGMHYQLNSIYYRVSCLKKNDLSLFF